MARVLIGTSGWHCDSWRGPFFPDDLPVKEQLCYYASQFETTELNGVFYRTPTREAVEVWRKQTGNDFVFAWKASNFITHWKRLSDRSANSLGLLEGRLSLLGHRGQCRPARFILQAIVKQAPLQLGIPPSELVSTAHPANAGRREHLALSVGSSRCAGSLDAHRRFRLCMRPRARRSLSQPLPAAGACAMAQRIKSWRRQGCDVYVYFDDDQDALKLRALL